MKNQCRAFVFASVAYLSGCGYVYAQISEKFAFGVKAGANHLNTRLVNQPRDLIIRLEGVYDANSFQAGVWGTIPINRWLFIDSDLGFIQKGHDLRTLPPDDKPVAINRYSYLNLSPRLGVTYKGAFVSVGPEVNVLVAKDVRPWKEADKVEWNLNARLGYQYRRWRADVFYSRSFTQYEELIWSAENQYKTLFYGNTLGFSVGFQLLGGKPKKQ
jgi:hypothetical protein